MAALSAWLDEEPVSHAMQNEQARDDSLIDAKRVAVFFGDGNVEFAMAATADEPDDQRREQLVNWYLEFNDGLFQDMGLYPESDEIASEVTFWSGDELTQRYIQWRSWDEKRWTGGRMMTPRTWVDAYARQSTNDPGHARDTEAPTRSGTRR